MSWRRIRPRFTLLGLLVFTAVCAVATQGYLFAQKHRAAKHLQWCQAIFEDGGEWPYGSESIASRYCRASEELCQAECAMPLADRASSRRAHLERILSIQRRVKVLAENAFGGDPAPDLQVVRTYRKRAEEMAAESRP